MGKNRRSTVFVKRSLDKEEAADPARYYHDLEATNDDRPEERRRIRLKQGKLLPRDPWGPGEFVSSCKLEERASPRGWAVPPCASAKQLKAFFDDAIDVKRYGGAFEREAKFGETKEAANYFVDWECRGHKFAFDAGVSFLTTVDRGCIYLLCGELVGEEGYGHIRNLSLRAPQVLFDRGMGEYGWAQEPGEDEWDELLTRLGLEDVEPSEFVACCLAWVGCDGSDHFRWGQRSCYVQPGRLDRCPLPILDAALRLCARVTPRASDTTPLTPLRPLRRHLDANGNDVAERDEPVTVSAAGARVYGAPAPATPPSAPATPKLKGSFGVAPTRGRRNQPRFSAHPRRMAASMGEAPRGSITLKDGTRAPAPDVVPESERNPEPKHPADIQKMPVKDLRAALAQRGLETKGLKKVLQKRLLDALGVPDGAPLEFKK